MRGSIMSADKCRHPCKGTCDQPRFRKKKVLTICKVAQEIQKVRVSVCGSGFYLSSKTSNTLH